jgi:hypothetical protein
MGTGIGCQQLFYGMAELGLDYPTDGRARSRGHGAGKPPVELAERQGEIVGTHIACSMIEEVDRLLPSQVPLVHERLEKGRLPAAACEGRLAHAPRVLGEMAARRQARDVSMSVGRG